MSLRLLVDENSESAWFVDVLRQAGHDVMTVGDLRQHGAPDEAVLAASIRENRILYTRDLDFLENRLHLSNHPGIIFEHIARKGTSMSFQEIAAAIARLEELVSNLRNQVHIINGYRVKSNS